MKKLLPLIMVFLILISSYSDIRFANADIAVPDKEQKDGFHFDENRNLITEITGRKGGALAYQILVVSIV